MGAHFPVHDKAPDEFVRYRPALPRGGYAEVARQRIAVRARRHARRLGALSQLVSQHAAVVGQRVLHPSVPLGPARPRTDSLHVRSRSGSARARQPRAQHALRPGSGDGGGPRPAGGAPRRRPADDRLARAQRREPESREPLQHLPDPPAADGISAGRGAGHLRPAADRADQRSPHLQHPLQRPPGRAAEVAAHRPHSDRDAASGFLGRRRHAGAVPTRQRRDDGQSGRPIARSAPR